MTERDEGVQVGLPPRIFLYTLDQISMILAIEMNPLKRSYIHFQGRTTGVKKPTMILARNIALPKEKPDWRVAEHELIRWMKKMGFVFSTDAKLRR